MDRRKRIGRIGIVVAILCVSVTLLILVTPGFLVLIGYSPFWLLAYCVIWPLWFLLQGFLNLDVNGLVNDEMRKKK